MNADVRSQSQIPSYESTNEVVSDSLVEAIENAIDADDLAEIKLLIDDLVPVDLALLIERLDKEHRPRLIHHIRDDFDPAVLTTLSSSTQQDVIDQLGLEAVALLLPKLDSDDAFNLIESLDQERQENILRIIPRENRHSFERIVNYPEDSAARMVQQEVVIVPSFWTVEAVIQFIQRAEKLPDEFYEVYVVNKKQEPTGKIPLKQLLRYRPSEKVTSIMDEDVKVIEAMSSQEEVAYLFRHYDLVSAPVVDQSGRIIGMITADDVVDLIDEESQREIMQLSGVSNVDFNMPILAATYKRIAGLMVTFINSFILGTIVYHFEHIIERRVALVALMPIVAGMSGASGTQVVAITVRALAMKMIRPNSLLKSVFKEVTVSFLNGLFFSAVLIVVLMLWYNDLVLGSILITAFIFNMTWSACMGVLLPVIIDRLGIDPAVGAGPVLSATTDVLGFLSILALANFFL